MSDRTFKDTQGREWSLTITARSAMRLRDDLGVDINDVTDPKNNFIEELTRDTWKIIDVVCVLTERRRDELGVSRDDFLDSLADEVIDEATRAFINAVVNFTRPIARPALMELVKLMDEGVERAANKLAEKVRTEVPAMLDQKLRELDQTSGE